MKKEPKCFNFQISIDNQNSILLISNYWKYYKDKLYIIINIIVITGNLYNIKKNCLAWWQHCVLGG